jgi:hypothetical protein
MVTHIIALGAIPCGEAPHHVDAAAGLHYCLPSAQPAAVVNCPLTHAILPHQLLSRLRFATVLCEASDLQNTKAIRSDVHILKGVMCEGKMLL